MRYGFVVLGSHSDGQIDLGRRFVVGTGGPARPGINKGQVQNGMHVRSPRLRTTSGFGHECSAARWPTRTNSAVSGCPPRSGRSGKRDAWAVGQGDRDANSLSVGSRSIQPTVGSRHELD